MDGGAAVYGYDGDGRRMKKTVGAETTYFFYGPGGLISEFSTTTGPTQAAATDRPSYRTSDKLGTAVLIIAASGTVIENNRTLPYGELWTTQVSSTNNKKFTSHQRDGESGLDYALNRFSTSAVGRFTAVDHGPSALYVPQTLNRYIYGLNDPVNHTDSDGRIARCMAGYISNGGGCIPLPRNSSGGVDDSELVFEHSDEVAEEPGSGGGGVSYHKPVQGDCVITGVFGEPRGASGRPHYGTDVSTNRGQGGYGASVSALVGGTIESSFAGSSQSASWVLVRADDGRYLTYMHITVNAKNGARIDAGQLLGVTNNTGSVDAQGRPVSGFAPHVHIFSTPDGDLGTTEASLAKRSGVEYELSSAGCRTDGRN